MQNIVLRNNIELLNINAFTFFGIPPFQLDGNKTDEEIMGLFIKRFIEMGSDKGITRITFRDQKFVGSDNNITIEALEMFLSVNLPNHRIMSHHNREINGFEFRLLSMDSIQQVSFYING